MVSIRATCHDVILTNKINKCIFHQNSFLEIVNVSVEFLKRILQNTDLEIGTI